MFLVDVTVNASNVIRVYVDSFNGLTIDQCVDLSRYLEGQMDRDTEDFELQVSSPGLNESLKVKEQFLKNKGRRVEILTTEDVRLEGIMEEAGPEGITLKTASRQKVEGHKKKQLIEKEYLLKYGDIKSAKVVVSFK